MRRAIPALALGLLLCLFGCGKRQDPIAPSFYYLYNEPSYSVSGGIIGSEQRLSADTAHSLGYLLALYLNGPISGELRNPFPKGSAIESMTMEGDTLLLTMNSLFGSLSGTDLTKACACMAMTVFDNTHAQYVSITTGDSAAGSEKTIMLSRDSLMLHDSLPPNS